MRPALRLLRTEPGARLFFAAHAQSAFGTGAAYIAILVVAYGRLDSPWAITGVLLAQFLPAMLLGPLVGAAADRWPRRTILVCADALRAAAFLGLALVGSFEATLTFALLVGVGNAAFNPTVLASIPNLVARPNLPAATSLFGALNELGTAAGPAVAAVGLLIVDAEALLLANGATFAFSAVILTRIAFRAPVDGAGTAARPSLFRAAWDGIGVAMADRGIRTVMLASTAAVVCLGAVNVGELLLAREALGASDSAFSLLVASMGLGITIGSMLGATGGATALLKRRYLGGLAICSGGLVGMGLAPGFAVALPLFFVTGVGNGVALTYERLLLQTVVPEDLMGRVFGVKNALISGAFATAFLWGGTFAALLGPRAVFVASGLAIFAAWAVATAALRGTWRAELEPATGAPAALEPAAAASV